VLEKILEIAFGILGLSIVVLVHESGHFGAARLMGIKVATFSIGFGKRLLGFRAGDTDYRISLIPLGGYCRFAGEHSLRRALDEKLDHIPSKPGEFYGSSAMKRILVCLSGPAANVLFAIIVFFLIHWIGFQEYYTAPKIILLSEWSENNAALPADIAGLQSGDTIMAVDGMKIDRYSALRRELIYRNDEQINLTVYRDGHIIELPITPQLNDEMGIALIGVLNWIDPVIGNIKTNSPPARAGFRPGDRILSAMGRPIPHTVALERLLNETEGNELPLLVENDGIKREIILKKPEETGFTDLLWDETDRSMSNGVFRIESGTSAKLGLFSSFSRGLEEAFNTWRATWKGFQMLFSGADIGNSIAGPFRLISDAGNAVLTGFHNGFGPGMLWSFEIMALISVSLAFLNLLPIPALDGGQILLFASEIIRNKPINPKSLYRYQFAGIIIVLAILIGATMNDLVRIRSRG